MSLANCCIIWLLLGIFAVRIHNLLTICLLFPFPFITDVGRKSWKGGSHTCIYAESVGKLLTKFHTVFVIQKSALCQRLLLLHEIQRKAGVSHVVLKRNVYDGLVCSKSSSLSFFITWSLISLQLYIAFSQCWKSQATPHFVTSILLW